MRTLWIALVVVGLAGGARADGTSTSRHLLAGVRAFKEARYEDALVELRVVARASDAPADLAFYLGPTLYKLGRYREALDVFVTSHAPPDALTDFYLGQTYFQLRLYRKARAVFAALRTRGLGPVLDEAAGRYVEVVDAAYAHPPEPATIDVYLTEGREELAHDPVAAAEMLEETREIEALAAARHRRAEIAEALAAAWNATGRPQQVIATLAADLPATDEGAWQLARAYAAVGDAAHARPMLEQIAKARGAHAADAGALLSTIAP